MHAWRDPSAAVNYVETQLTDGPAPKTKKVAEKDKREVRTGNVNKKKILAKIPKYVYDLWFPATTGPQDTAPTSLREVGKMTISEKQVAGKGVQQFEIQLAQPASTPIGEVSALEGTSQENRIPLVATIEREGVVSLEGTLDSKVDFRRKMISAKRYDDGLSKRQLQVDNSSSTSLRKMPKREPQKSEKSADKFVRMDRDKLTEYLFRIFEKDKNLKLDQLRQKTQQPTEWLKEVLKDIAVYLKKGPNKFTYQLLPECGGEVIAEPVPLADNEV